MGVVKRPNTTAMIMQGLCLQSRMGQGKSVHPPALLRHEVVSRPVLLLVQRVDVVYWAGHQDDQEKGNGSYYAAAHLQREERAPQYMI